MPENYSKNAFGPKEGIERAKENGEINIHDILYLDNGETGWIDKYGNVVLATQRTQAPIKVNGIENLGIPNGGTIPAGSSLTEIVTMLVQKALPVTYTQPKITLTDNSNKTNISVETGTSVHLVLKATFVKNDAGNLTEITVSKNSEQLHTGSSSPLTYSPEEFFAEEGEVSFLSSASYLEGAIKNNNLGNPIPEGHIEAGTVTSAPYKVIGQRNLFWGTGTGTLPSLTSDIIRGLKNKKLNPTKGYSWKIPVSVGEQFIIFAYPADLPDISEILYVEMNDPNCAANFTKTLVDVADARGGTNGLKSFKVYSYRMAIPAAASMTFKVTI